MQKLTVLFADSAREFKHVRTITMCGLFAALAFILESFSIELGSFIKIGFSGLPNEFVDLLFGPVVGSVFAGMLDILKLIIKPGGGWIPGLTLNAFLAGIIYGCFFYKHPVRLWRILAAKLIVALVLNVGLGTFWLSQFYGKALMAMIPARFVKNMVMWPINSLVLYLLMKAFESAGIFRMIRELHPLRREKGKK
ncbi:MAG: folate family ECF transporter S component [Eubacteriales bacterium]|nr:folate family ECF transporter S component [Eubacteriales bacterium]